MPLAPLPPAICVLGLGLIGGSLLRAATPHVPTFGWSRGDETRAAAAADGFDVKDDLATALRRAAEVDALVVLAAPVTAFSGLLRSIHDASPEVALTDVGSVKGPVAEEVARLAPRARYIGSHPMTGTEHSGWEAGNAALFGDRIWVTTLTEESDLQLWGQIAGLAVTIGSRVVPCTAEAHDDAAARISHLPHLLAAALAQVGAMGGPLALSLAAGSFADGTRVAATRPELTRAMCEANRGPLVGAMDEMLAQLGVARGSLASTGSLDKITRTGFEARQRFENRFDGFAVTALTGPGLIDQLLSVGMSGGYVTDVSLGRAGLSALAMYPVED